MWKTIALRTISLGVFALTGLSGHELFAKHHSSSSSSDSSSSKSYHARTLPGSWQPLQNLPSLDPETYPALNGPLLLTDGSVMFINFTSPYTGEVWKLTPDAFGSYQNGSWSQLASLPIGYAPLYYASAVLPDGRVLIQGGEYNGPNYDKEYTSLGAIYDPVSDSWTPLAPPPFFTCNIGDAPSVVLADGTYMITAEGNKQAALLDAHTLTWKETGTATKWDPYSEEGFTLLPNEKVLVIDGSGVNAPNTIITTNQPGVGPFFAMPGTSAFTNNVAPTAPIVGPGAVATPNNTACSPINDLTAKIGICYRSIFCASGTIVRNMGNANALAVIEISDEVGPFSTPGGNGEPFSCVIGTSDGNALVNAINAHPNLTITITQAPAAVIQNYAELYNPETGTWGSSGGNTIVPLNTSGELGPAILRPDGTVFCTGDNGNSAIYDSYKNSWVVGPRFPATVDGQLGCQDAPGALLPNGNVLVAASPGFDPPMSVFEFNGSVLVEQPSTALGPYVPAYSLNMLVLPTGQILSGNYFGVDVEIYTPGDRSYNPDWAPVISKAPEEVRHSKTYKIEGVRFNGMSQGAMYGDDYQSATNYPLVRITNSKTGHVCYCRTHHHSYMGVASDKEVHTYFDVPHNIERGDSKIEVVANGIASKPQSIYVK